MQHDENEQLLTRLFPGAAARLRGAPVESSWVRSASSFQVEGADGSGKSGRLRLIAGVQRRTVALCGFGSAILPPVLPSQRGTTDCEREPRLFAGAALFA